MMFLDEYVLAFRKKERYTQKRLAELIGCDQSVISRLEGGAGKTEEWVLRKFAEISNTKFEDILAMRRESVTSAEMRAEKAIHALTQPSTAAPLTAVSGGNTTIKSLHDDVTRRELNSLFRELQERAGRILTTDLKTQLEVSDVASAVTSQIQAAKGEGGAVQAKTLRIGMIFAAACLPLCMISENGSGLLRLEVRGRMSDAELDKTVQGRDVEPSGYSEARELIGLLDVDHELAVVPRTGLIPANGSVGTLVCHRSMPQIVRLTRNAQESPRISFVQWSDLVSRLKAKAMINCQRKVSKNKVFFLTQSMLGNDLIEDLNLLRTPEGDQLMEGIRWAEVVVKRAASVMDEGAVEEGSGVDLLVDEPWQGWIRHKFEQMGYQVETCTDPGKRAVELGSWRQSFDLVWGRSRTDIETINGCLQALRRCVYVCNSSVEAARGGVETPQLIRVREAYRRMFGGTDMEVGSWLSGVRGWELCRTFE